mgnify:CR=1 FL=1|tara:strand:+ start:2967 stop:3575 length:609 start_codon:yes stop_codon:yes gene_type:complete
MATYNGAIQVRPCTVINIPQPGILVDILPGEANFDPASPQGIVLNNLGASVVESLISNHISGGDVVYLTDTSTSIDYVLEIERVDISNPGLEAIVFKNLCTIPPAGILLANLSIQIYRGNYSPTNGDTPAIGGYTGAGNSEGYNIVADQAGVGIKVLTVNNDLITLFLSQGKPSDLLVVKVLENPSIGPGDPPNLLALSLQY